MTARLKSLVIKDFRSLKGEVIVPLDAQVVLVHGANGLGKTSVLTAIELGLTGRVAHLADAGKEYHEYLTNLDANEGSIQLTTTAPLSEGGSVGGEVSFGEAFAATPLLNEEEALVFSNRCYLPQAALGRLLELYDDQTTNSESRLTRFVNELLGLDPLDALVDGLDPAFNVTRIRNLVPEFREIEDAANALSIQMDDLGRKVQATRQARDERRGELHRVLSAIDPLMTVPEILSDLEAELTDSSDVEAELSTTSGLRSDLSRALQSWNARLEGDPGQLLAVKEQEVEAAARTLEGWRKTTGAEFDALATTLAPFLPDLPPFESSPVEARRTAMERAQAEINRRQGMIDKGDIAAKALVAVKAVAQRASARIIEIDRDLSAGAADAKSIASALATIAPHVDGETCPVCERNFAERVPHIPLATFIAGRIAALTTEAGRLQALATERAGETARLTEAQQRQLSVEREILDKVVANDLTLSVPKLRAALSSLQAMEAGAAQGAQAIVSLAEARASLQSARRREEQSSSALSDAGDIIELITQRELSSFDTVEDAFAEAASSLEQRALAANAAISNRAAARSLLSLAIGDDTTLARLEEQLQGVRLLAAERFEAIEGVTERRKTAKAVSNAADTIRTDLVKSVFNTSLNKLWSDLFVRLAPSEDFVPTFNLVTGPRGKAEAKLETRHRSGVGSGTPGAMLSQGNLNTAALTLFLALHLSAPSKQPWLILDDPVQSMDDVHIAQFAALLRTLSKKLDKQIVIAVHERALFEYLTLELSPAFADDTLLTIEITRTSDGSAVATPVPYDYQPDAAIVPIAA